MTGMNDATRKRIVSELLEQFKKKYKSKLLFFGLKGSMARGDFTHESDIDVVVIVNKRKGTWHEFYVNNTVIDISVFTPKEATDYISTPGGLWPLQVGSLLDAKRLFERGAIVKQLHKIKEKIPRKRFLEACYVHGLDEYMRKARKEFAAKKFNNLRYVAWELVFMACMNLALINETYYSTHGANMLEQLDRMKTFFPSGFKQSAELCFHSEPTKVFTGCKAVYAHAKAWEKKFKIDKLEKNKQHKTIQLLKI